MSDGDGRHLCGADLPDLPVPDYGCDLPAVPESGACQGGGGAGFPAAGPGNSQPGRHGGGSVRGPGGGAGDRGVRHPDPLLPEGFLRGAAEELHRRGCAFGRGPFILLRREGLYRL